MAQVDFSNAVLDIRTDITARLPMNYDNFFLLNSSPYLHDSTTTRITANENMSGIQNTPSKVSIMYTGEFTASGTEFYMGGTNGAEWRPWKVSNISFSSGDIYSFVIDIETSGNV